MMGSVTVLFASALSNDAMRFLQEWDTGQQTRGYTMLFKVALTALSIIILSKQYNVP